jgi:hypothetical protein
MDGGFAAIFAMKLLDEQRSKIERPAARPPAPSRLQ